MKQLISFGIGLFFLANACRRPDPPNQRLQTAPSPDSLRAYVRAYLTEVWDKHDFDLARQKYWHPDVYNANAPEIPHGPESMKQQIGAFLVGFPDAGIEFEDAIAEGNTIAARIVLKGTHTGRFLGIEPTGKSIRVREYVFLEIKDGKLWKFYPLVDFASLQEQLIALK